MDDETAARLKALPLKRGSKTHYRDVENTHPIDYPAPVEDSVTGVTVAPKDPYAPRVLPTEECLEFLCVIEDAKALPNGIVVDRNYIVSLKGSSPHLTTNTRVLPGARYGFEGHNAFKRAQAWIAHYFRHLEWERRAYDDAPLIVGRYV